MGATLLCLAPGASSKRRCGRTNARLAVLLGLPGTACVVQVGDSPAVDVPVDGPCVICDPSFEHTISNPSEELDAAVLIVEAWHQNIKAITTNETHNTNKHIKQSSNKTIKQYNNNAITNKQILETNT